MANTFVTLKTIARQALPCLIDNLVFPNLCHRDFSEELHDVGDTVRVRRPTVFTAQEFLSLIHISTSSASCPAPTPATRGSVRCAAGTARPPPRARTPESRTEAGFHPSKSPPSSARSRAHSR